MADVKIRKLDDWVVESFRARAHEADRSFEEELRQLLTDTARERRRRLIVELEELNLDLRAKYGELPDSTPLIREERDQYGRSCWTQAGSLSGLFPRWAMLLQRHRSPRRMR